VSEILDPSVFLKIDHYRKKQIVGQKNAAHLSIHSMFSSSGMRSFYTLKYLKNKEPATCNQQAIRTINMPSLTPLHETYCRWDRTPPSQADLLEGLAQLASTSLSGIHELVQMIHRELLLNTLGMSEQQSRYFQALPRVEKIYQFSYRALQRYGHYFLAPGLRQVIEHFPGLHRKDLTPQLHSLIGILNGVLGDYLLAQQNPLALPMVLYEHHGRVQQGRLKGKVVIFVHGLCMNHLTWTNSNFTGIGAHLLTQPHPGTMLYLNYNTGRRISANGRSFANLLNDLIQRNRDISQIDLIGHSMGGLVSRSALFYGKQNMQGWLSKVGNLVCLGSPHHGAVLERFGFTLQEKLGRFPLINMIGNLVNIRSNGIIDLRHGSVRDDDWEYLDARIGTMDDSRKPAPLPSHIQAFFVAGTVEAEHINSRALKIIGDYLVSIKSALGEHPNPRFQLKVPEHHKAVFFGLNHFEIQYHTQVAQQIVQWFYPDPLLENTRLDHYILHTENIKLEDIAET
jgi:pimeloyl-ACP methyl ester carboxylesterase